MAKKMLEGCAFVVVVACAHKSPPVTFLVRRADGTTVSVVLGNLNGAQ